MWRLCGVLALLAPLTGVSADEPVKKDYAEFSKMVRKIVAAQVPRFLEDVSGWGQTVPVPPDMRVPRLRTVIKVGNRMELPDGLWRKVRLSMKDPDRDLEVRVVDFKNMDNKKYRLILDVAGSVAASVEAQQWKRGLLLLGFNADADITVGLFLECDVAVKLDASKFPPQLKVEPNIATLRTELKDFNLKQVTLRRLGRVLEGEQAREIGNQCKGILHDVLRACEPFIKAEANQAIARSIKEGKGTISADAIFKIMNGK